MNSLLLGIMALAPAIIGPLPVKDNVLTIGICGDDPSATIEIPLPSKSSPTDVPQDGPCHSAACHASQTRKKFDLNQ